METIIGVTDFLNVSALVRAKDPITFSRFWTAKLQLSERIKTPSGRKSKRAEVIALLSPKKT